MKPTGLLLLCILIGTDLFSQPMGKDGSTILQAVQLRTATDSITRFKLKNNAPFYLGYYLPLAANVKLELTIAPKKRLVVYALRRIMNPATGSIRLAEYKMTDEKYVLNLDVRDDQRYLLIRNIDPHFHGQINVAVKVLQIRQLALPKTDLRPLLFALNKYSNSYNAKLLVDSPSLVYFALPGVATNKGLNFDLSLSDSKLRDKKVIYAGSDFNKLTFIVPL